MLRKHWLVHLLLKSTQNLRFMKVTVTRVMILIPSLIRRTKLLMLYFSGEILNTRLNLLLQSFQYRKKWCVIYYPSIRRILKNWNIKEWRAPKAQEDQSIETNSGQSKIIEFLQKGDQLELKILRTTCGR